MRSAWLLAQQRAQADANEQAAKALKAAERAAAAAEAARAIKEAAVRAEAAETAAAEAAPPRARLGGLGGSGRLQLRGTPRATGLTPFVEGSKVVVKRSTGRMISVSYLRMTRSSVSTSCLSLTALRRRACTRTCARPRSIQILRCSSSVAMARRRWAPSSAMMQRRVGPGVVRASMSSPSPTGCRSSAGGRRRRSAAQSVPDRAEGHSEAQLGERRRSALFKRMIRSLRRGVA